MAIHVFGSINIDHVHRVPHLPRPGETLADTGYARHLGGKGLNQAVAAARAGARVHLSGAVGPDGGWILEWLAAEGIDLAAVARLEAPTGHAVICVAPDGENCIVIHGGANRALGPEVVDRALAPARPGDWWLVQNETARVAESAERARAAGLRVAFAAAPFDAALAERMMPLSHLLALNEGEAADLAATLGRGPEAWPVPAVLVTLGARGARLLAAEGWPGPGGPRRSLEVPALPAEAVDTTGAGDGFLGAFLAGLDRGVGAPAALGRAAAAAASAVSRHGAAPAMARAGEIDARLSAETP